MLLAQKVHLQDPSGGSAAGTPSASGAPRALAAPTALATASVPALLPAIAAATRRPWPSSVTAPDAPGKGRGGSPTAITASLALTAALTITAALATLASAAAIFNVVAVGGSTVCIFRAISFGVDARPRPSISGYVRYHGLAGFG